MIKQKPLLPILNDPRTEQRMKDILSNCNVTPTGCIEATKYVYGSGSYPRTFVAGAQNVSLHRLFCAAAHGECPDGHVAHHKCNNKHCINSDHIEWITPLENTRQAAKDGKLVIGEANHASKYTDTLIETIRSEWARDSSRGRLSELSRQYGPSISHVKRIVDYEARKEETPWM